MALEMGGAIHALSLIPVVRRCRFIASSASYGGALQTPLYNQVRIDGVVSGVVALHQIYFVRVCALNVSFLPLGSSLSSDAFRLYHKTFVFNGTFQENIAKIAGSTLAISTQDTPSIPFCENCTVKLSSSSSSYETTEGLASCKFQ